MTTEHNQIGIVKRVDKSTDNHSGSENYRIVDSQKGAPIAYVNWINICGAKMSISEAVEIGRGTDNMIRLELKGQEGQSISVAAGAEIHVVPK